MSGDRCHNCHLLVPDSYQPFAQSTLITRHHRCADAAGVRTQGKDIAATSYSVDAVDPVAKSKLEKGKQGRIMKER
jgi:hypothetical protein